MMHDSCERRLMSFNDKEVSRIERVTRLSLCFETLR